MHLHEALDSISEIRSRIAAAQTFRGYRALTTAATALAALATGLLQPLLATTPQSFILLWSTTAILCLALTITEILLRFRCAPDHQKHLTLLAAEQFLPAILAGALFTFAFLDFLPTLLWLLPPLWMLLFSLGLFASVRLLPRLTFAVAAFYLIAALLTLLSGPADALSPWFMGATFTIGQSAMALILYLRLEKSHA